MAIFKILKIFFNFKNIFPFKIILKISKMSGLAKFSSDINRYIISVNGQLTGYAPTLESAKFIAEKMAEEMVIEFQTTKPHYISEIIPQTNKVVVKCISRGWFYNGTREFNITFSPIPELVYKPASTIEITETPEKTEAIVEIKNVVPQVPQINENQYVPSPETLRVSSGCETPTRVAGQPSNLASKGGYAAQVSASADSPNSPISSPSFYSHIPFPPNLPPPPKNYRRVPRRKL